MHRYNESKMYTHLNGFCKGANLTSSLRALGFMREKRGKQTRANGQPYVVHPLWMANYAIAVAIFCKFPDLKANKFWGNGLWGKGTYYGSVGMVSQETIVKYIENQKSDLK